MSRKQREKKDSTPAPATPADPARENARLAATAGALFVLGLLGVTPFLPDMTMWGTNALRFTGPAGWMVWGVAVALCVLALTGRLDATIDAAGRAFDKKPVLVVSLLAIVTAIVVLALPDRVYYVGDFLFRRGLNEIELQQSALAPQLMPLDRFIHLTLAPALRDAFGLTTVDMDRWIGALEAALLALASTWLVRALGARGALGLALVIAVAFAGGLSIFTGYGKSFVEMSVLVVVLAASAVECVSRGRHAVPLVLAAGGYLALHRTGFVVLPAVVVALALGWRAHARDPRARNELLVAVVVLVVGLLALAPKAIGILRAYDASHHAPGALFAPLRLLDLTNIALLLAPLLPAALLAFAARPRAGRTAEATVLGLLALSFGVLAAGSFPQQGLARDVDVFVPNALAWTCLAAFVLATALEARAGAARAARTAAVLALVTVASTLGWMFQQHDTERGFARVRATVAGPPMRSDAERSMSLDFLGAALFRLARYGEAADAYRDASQLSPNPRFFVQWGVAAMRSGRDTEARTALREAVTRNSSLVPAWRMLAALAAKHGDLAEADRALASAAALAPGDRQLASDAASIRMRLLQERTGSADTLRVPLVPR